MASGNQDYINVKIVEEGGSEFKQVAVLSLFLLFGFLFVKDVHRVAYSHQDGCVQWCYVQVVDLQCDKYNYCDLAPNLDESDADAFFDSKCISTLAYGENTLEFYSFL